jgi:hypothetical protein
MLAVNLDSWFQRRSGITLLIMLGLGPTIKGLLIVLEVQDENDIIPD